MPFASWGVSTSHRHKSAGAHEPHGHGFVPMSGREQPTGALRYLALLLTVDVNEGINDLAQWLEHPQVPRTTRAGRT